MEAAAAGASQSICLVANIAANLIAFLSLLDFVNAALSWLGSMVDYEELSFQVVHHSILRFCFLSKAVIRDAEEHYCGRNLQIGLIRSIFKHRCAFC